MRQLPLRRLLTPAVLLSCLVSAVPAHAADPDAADNWARWAGVPREATVRSLDFNGASLFAASDGDGVFASPTAVGPWVQGNGGLDSGEAKAVRQVKTGPDGRTYAATSGGLFRSAGGLGGWSPVGAGPGPRKLNMGGVQSIMFTDPTGLSMTAAVSGAGGSGVYYTSDGGEHWDRASGMANPENVYYLTSGPLQTPMYAAADNGVYSSLDFGHSWILTSDGIPPGETTLRVAVSPTSPNDLYASTSSSVYHSSTGGIVWNEVPGTDGQTLPSGGKRAFLLTPDLSGKFGPNRMLVGTDKGVYGTVDNGAHWKPLAGATFLPDAATPMEQRQVQSLSIGFNTPVIMAGTQGFGVFNLPVTPVGGGTPTITPVAGNMKAGTELSIANLDETNADFSKRRFMNFLGTKPYFFSYQWFRCSTAQPSSCTSAIDGETDSTFVVPKADALLPNAATLRYALRVTVRSLVSPLPISVMSTPTGPGVAPLPGSAPKPLAATSLGLSPAGQPVWGSTLTINAPTWRTEGSAALIFPDAIRYGWERCDGNGNNCKPIPGATKAKYEITTEDIGDKISAYVSATKSGAGGESYFVGLSSTVLNKAPVTTVKPRIVGDAWTGVKLSSSAGGYSGFDMTYERRWMRCEADGLGCNAIAFPSETGPTYTARAADLGKRLQLEIKAIAKDPNQNRVTTVFSETTAVITDPPPPAPDDLPIGGGPLPGPTPGPGPTPVPTPTPTPGPGGPKGLVLTIIVPKKVKAGVEIKAPKTVAGFKKISYQWLRNGKKIKKATKRAYRLTKADRGRSIACRITLTPATGGTKAVITTTPVNVPKK